MTWYKTTRPRNKVVEQHSKSYGRQGRLLLVLILGVGEGRLVVVGGGGGGEDEGAVLGFLLVFVVVVAVGGEVDAGAALEGGEEGGGDAGSNPASPALHGSACFLPC